MSDKKSTSVTLSKEIVERARKAHVNVSAASRWGVERMVAAAEKALKEEPECPARK